MDNSDSKEYGSRKVLKCVDNLVRHFLQSKNLQTCILNYGNETRCEHTTIEFHFEKNKV